MSRVIEALLQDAELGSHIQREHIGVVGQTPTIEPGQSFTYTSGCPLRTPQGIMVGSYQMVNARGHLFSVAIPAFSLDSPFAKRKLN